MTDTGARPPLHQRLNAEQQLFLALFLLAMMFIAEVWPHLAPGRQPRSSDFVIFRLVARLFWQGNVADVYDAGRLLDIQRTMAGTDAHLLFGYPPPYILMIAPLGLLATGVDYLVFTGPALLIFGWCMVRLAHGGTAHGGTADGGTGNGATGNGATGSRAGLAVLAAALPCFVTLISGQNGLLTGALLALACVGLQSGRALAGIPLGLMIIKPQLALGMGLYVLIRRDWRTLAVAMATALAAAVLATAVLGIGIWTAFLAGVAEQASMLAAGFFPFHRMQSPFALALSLHLPGPAASILHAVAALAAAAVIVMATLRLPRATALGIALLAGPQLSPYMFDYDLTVVALGLALLLGGLSGPLPTAAWAMLAGLQTASINALVQLGRASEISQGEWPPAWGAAIMLISFWLAALLLLRQGAPSRQI